MRKSVKAIRNLFRAIGLEPELIKPLDSYDTGETANYWVTFDNRSAIIWVTANGELANTKTPEELQALIDKHIED